MGKLKFYALCSRNTRALSRHARKDRSGIPREDLVIVLNTLDEDFKEEAIEWCDKNKVEYVVTESDGTPSTGKNSVLDLFLESDNDYMVLIDGDDFLTPHGVWTYKHIAELKDTPDVICLKNQFSIWPKWSTEVTDSNIDPDSIAGYESRFFMTTNWYDAMTGLTIDQMKEGALENEDFDLDPEKMYTEELKQMYRRWSYFNYYYIDGMETHSRVVMMSKKAASIHRFNTSFKVGEDTIQYLELKNMAINGEITMNCIDETVPTYVYDQRVTGVSVGSTWEDDGAGFLNWLKPLVHKYEQMEHDGMLHDSELDELKVEYPPYYTPEVLNVMDWRIPWY